MACDSYLMVLIEVFMNHILAENIFHEAYRENTRLWPYNPPISTKLFCNFMTLKTFLLTIASIIHFFIWQKVSKHHFLRSRK